MYKKHAAPGEVLVFRRFRRGAGGKVYDAWKYGIKAWPIRFKRDAKKT
jgi:hypothetical protein